MVCRDCPLVFNDHSESKTVCCEPLWRFSFARCDGGHIPGRRQLLNWQPGRDDLWSSPSQTSNAATKELAMTAMTNLRAVDFQPLEFMISLGPDRSFVLREMRGRASGVFAELSSVILFVRGVCQARGCTPVIKFDQSLACVRAAG
jgi:hypothetical protein